MCRSWKRALMRSMWSLSSTSKRLQKRSHDLRAQRRSYNVGDPVSVRDGRIPAPQEVPASCGPTFHQILCKEMNKSGSTVGWSCIWPLHGSGTHSCPSGPGPGPGPASPCVLNPAVKRANPRVSIRIRQRVWFSDEFLHFLIFLITTEASSLWRLWWENNVFGCNKKEKKIFSHHLIWSFTKSHNHKCNFYKSFQTSVLYLLSLFKSNLTFIFFY